MLQVEIDINTFNRLFVDSLKSSANGWICTNCTFNNISNINRCEMCDAPHNKLDPHLERAKFISLIYQKWIKHKQTESDTYIAGIYDIINNHFGNNYNVNSFLDDYRFVTHQRRDILPYHDEGGDEKGDECSIESCFITKRAERNKSYMTRNNHQRNRMFFVDTNTRNNDHYDDQDKDIVIQHILDSLHTLIYHTLRIDFRKYIKPVSESKNDEAQEEDKTDSNRDHIISCFDSGVERLGEIIKQNQEATNRYRTSRSRYNEKNNKFVTKSTSKYNHHDDSSLIEDDSIEEITTASSQGNGYEQFDHEQGQTHSESHSETGSCFMDYLFDAVNENKSKLNEEMIMKLKIFLSSNGYETDSICDDINNYPESNIINDIGDYKQEKIVLLSILKKFVYIEASHETLYSAGYRYFYWDYYKNIDEETNILYIQNTGQPACEGNPGYKIEDWFIPRKYKDLREELLTNAISNVSVQQFNNIKQQATMKLTNWLNDPDTMVLKSEYKLAKQYLWAERCYGIKQGTTISVEHIMSLMFYTNFSNQSAAFSATFRRTHGFETDEHLKQRN